jgi:hypothetical protein
MGQGQASILPCPYVIRVRFSLFRDSPHRTVLLSLCGAILLALTCSRSTSGAEALNFPPSDFNILSADTGQLIGHGHYTLDQTTSVLILHGENRYLNGEYDIEEAKLADGEDHPLPPLLSFRHDFFNADGSPSIVARLDTETGLAACGKTEAGKLDLKTQQFKFPPDTYAGASVLIPIQNFVGRRDRGDILKLHVFNCAPSPKLIAVDVKPQFRAQSWPDYPGELEKIDITPNFGFWTVVVQPFIPKLAAWFDPAQNSLLVGALLQRYYKGPKIILVRKREASIAADKAPPTVGP